MEKIFKTISKANTRIMEIYIQTYDLLSLPCSSASRNKDGNMPTMKPIKRQMEGAGYLSSKTESILAIPKNPKAIPKITGNNFGTWVLKL